MIYEVEGDMMLTRAQVIAHGVAVNDPMIRGLARKLHQRFPTMVTEFRQWCQQQKPEPGEIWLWGELDKIRIVTLVTQEGGGPGRPGRESKIAIHRTLRALKRLAIDEKFTSIAMQKLGDGFGGVDWFEVREMMDSQLDELLFPIFVYVTELDGQVASEPGL